MESAHVRGGQPGEPFLQDTTHGVEGAEDHDSISGVRPFSRLAESFAGIGIVLATLVLPFAFEETTTATAWAAEGALLRVQCYEGLDVAQRISQLSTVDRGGDLRQTPQPPVVISTVRVVM